LLDNCRFNKKACDKAATDPSLLATDMADYLVEKGMPFRQAHHIVGAVVAYAENAGKPLDKLSVAELKGLSGDFESDALEVFDLKRAMGRRKMTGAPGTAQVRRQLERWERKLSYV